MKKLYHYAPMMVLSIFAVLFLLVFEVTFFVSQVLFKPDIYSQVMGKQAVAEAIYEDLDEYFEQFAAPTGIPKEVFTSALDEDELSNGAYALLEDCLEYLTNEDAAEPVVAYDYTELEDSITSYIEEYSEENDIEKDDEYYELIDQTISTAENQIASRLDIIMLHTLCETNVAKSVHKYAGYITAAMVIAGIILAVLIVAMFVINRHHLRDMTYWVGTIMFSSAVVWLIPTVYLDSVGYFDSFFVTTEHIYLTVTGLFDEILSRVIYAQTIVLIIGIALIILTIIIHMLYSEYRKRLRNRHAND